jgi:hypothetical protein
MIQLATVRPPQAKDHRQHCGDKSDNSDDNQDIGHDNKLYALPGRNMETLRVWTVKNRRTFRACGNKATVKSVSRAPVRSGINHLLTYREQFRGHPG